MVGNELRFNVHFTNGGNDLAKNPRWDAKSYVGKPDDIVTEKDTSIDFDKWWISSKHQGFATTSVRPREPAFFSFKTPALTDDDLKGIVARRLTLYILIRFTWSDRTGNWVGDECFSFQDLNHDFEVTHACGQYHNNPRYRASN